MRRGIGVSESTMTHLQEENHALRQRVRQLEAQLAQVREAVGLDERDRHVLVLADAWDGGFGPISARERDLRNAVRERRDYLGTADTEVSRR